MCNETTASRQRGLPAGTLNRPTTRVVACMQLAEQFRCHCSRLGFSSPLLKQQSQTQLRPSLDRRSERLTWLGKTPGTATLRLYVRPDAIHKCQIAKIFGHRPTQAVQLLHGVKMGTLRLLLECMVVWALMSERMTNSNAQAVTLNHMRT